VANWIERFKQFFYRQRADESQRVQRFLPVIEAQEFEAIDAARDWVQAQDVAPLVALYWKLENWSHKRAVVEILRDQYHAAMRDMMLDFLRAPVAAGDEPTELAQAIALGFVDEKYDRFMTYYNDRELLARDVQAVLRKHGLQAETPPQPEKRSAPQADPTRSPNQRLMEGAMRGELATVQQALADGANVNVVISGGDYDGCSALIMALMRQRFDVAAYLIDHEADVNHRRSDRHRPDPARGQTPLWWAANHGHMALAQALVAQGADVNTPDHHGGTPLTQAASSGHLDMVRYLVQNGADIHAQIYDGRKAFNLAVTHGRKRVAEYLLSLGNDPNEAGSSGYTPLMIAAENNFYDLARSLIARGADVNAQHPGPGIYAALRGWTPLVFAVNAGYVRMTRLLLRSGADVYCRVPAGRNARGEPLPARGILDFARGKRAESIVKVLREAGGTDV
jgi:ankyrin repeat protein